MASTSLLSHCLFFFFLAGVAVSAPFISGHIFESHGSIGRTLLQNKENCNVNFEFLNYSIITSECKGPQYLPKLCCPAFKRFACQHLDAINNLKSECATTMFSYINLYGKYPPGLFASECVEGKDGLDCTGYTDIIGEEKIKSAGCIAQTLSPYLVAAAASLVLLFQMF